MYSSMMHSIGASSLSSLPVQRLLLSLYGHVCLIALGITGSQAGILMHQAVVCNATKLSCVLPIRAAVILNEQTSLPQLPLGSTCDVGLITKLHISKYME
jgi:hypothetical protein